MLCPFMKHPSNMPRKCTKECALYYQELTSEGKEVINMQGCSLTMMTQYLDEIRYHLCHGVEVVRRDGD